MDVLMILFFFFFFSFCIESIILDWTYCVWNLCYHYISTKTLIVFTYLGRSVIYCHNHLLPLYSCEFTNFVSIKRTGFLHISICLIIIIVVVDIIFAEIGNLFSSLTLVFLCCAILHYPKILCFRSFLPGLA